VCVKLKLREFGLIRCQYWCVSIWNLISLDSSSLIACSIWTINDVINGVPKSFTFIHFNQILGCTFPCCYDGTLRSSYRLNDFFRIARTIVLIVTKKVVFFTKRASLALCTLVTLSFMLIQNIYFRPFGNTKRPSDSNLNQQKTT